MMMLMEKMGCADEEADDADDDAAGTVCEADQ